MNFDPTIIGCIVAVLVLILIVILNEKTKSSNKNLRKKLKLKDYKKPFSYVQKIALSGLVSVIFQPIQHSIISQRSMTKSAKFPKAPHLNVKNERYRKILAGGNWA